MVKLHVLSVGKREPAWLREGLQTYRRRMSKVCSMRFKRVPADTAGRDQKRQRDREGRRQLALLPAGAYVVALDQSGRQWNSEALARHLGRWLADGRQIAFLIGGSEGLAPICRQRADLVWSLSELTFPHDLVSLFLTEQLYRAWSILAGLPYHRSSSCCKLHR